MRNLIIALIFLGITGYAVTIFFNNFEYTNGRLSEKIYSYPDTVVIENQEGTEIKVTLLGRNSNYLQFEQKNGRKFIYPIGSLSEKCQTLVMKYPDSGIEDVSEYLSSGNIEMNDAYIIQLETEVSKLKAEAKRLQSKADATMSQTELRTLDRKIEKLYEEITKLEDKIASRQ